MPLSLLVPIFLSTSYRNIVRCLAHISFFFNISSLYGYFASALCHWIAGGLQRAKWKLLKWKLAQNLSTTQRKEIQNSREREREREREYGRFYYFFFRVMQLLFVRQKKSFCARFHIGLYCKNINSFASSPRSSILNPKTKVIETKFLISFFFVARYFTLLFVPKCYTITHK